MRVTEGGAVAGVGAGEGSAVLEGGETNATACRHD